MRGINLFILLALASCTSQSSWVVQQGMATAKEQDAAKLIHPSPHLDLEFLRIHETVHCFLVVKGRPLLANPKNPKETILRFETKTGSFSVPVQRHTGGQKFALSEEAKSLLWELLNQNEPFKLSLADYTATIDPKGFKESYQTFSKTPFLQNPFRLPI